MINTIRNEPVLKRLFIGSLGVIIVIYTCFMAIQYMQLKHIHREQIKTYERMVGSLVSKYPNDEVDIVKSIFSNDNNTEVLGNSTLKKYGYDLEMSMMSDVTFTQYLKNFINYNSIALALVLIVNIIILFIFINKVFKYLDNISLHIDSFMKGNYEYEDKVFQEGIISRISNKLHNLGKSLSLNFEKLNNEKESSKALVTDISHQLKTPLASLSLYNSLLQDEDLTVDERQEFLKSSESTITKLKNLIESLVNISRLEASMIKIKMEDNSIKETLVRAINSVYLKALNKNIDINLDEFEDIIVPHDSKWTEESIFNVLDNSVKYTNENGKIDIKVSTNHNYVRIDIKDTGIGIGKDEYTNIFKRFYRVNSSKVKNIEGSGVGLYLTRKILEEQGGSIMVKSQVGVGSEFLILLRK